MSTEYLGKATGLGVGAGTTHDEARRRTVRFPLGNYASRVPVGSLPVTSDSQFRLPVAESITPI